MSRDLVTTDRDAPDVLADLQHGPWAMAQIDPKVELAKFEAAAELQRKLVPASIRATRPQDWIKMGKSVYLQATGVERIASLWGLVFGEPNVTRENYDDGNFAYVVIGAAGSRLTGVFYKGIQGGRSSADPFFDAFDEEKPKDFGTMSAGAKEAWRREHRVAPDPLDVRKAAVTNWQVRAASMLTGLRGLMLKDLEDAGIYGVEEVGFRGGARGGDATPGDLKAKQTALWNDILKATQGDIEAAHQILIEITRYDAYEREGKTVPAYAGAKTVDKLSERAIDISRRKLAKHPTFGIEARQPGEEG